MFHRGGIFVFLNNGVAPCFIVRLSFTEAQRPVSAKDGLKKKKIIRNAHGDLNIG